MGMPKIYGVVDGMMNLPEIFAGIGDLMIISSL